MRGLERESLVEVGWAEKAAEGVKEVEVAGSPYPCASAKAETSSRDYGGLTAEAYCLMASRLDEAIA